MKTEGEAERDGCEMCDRRRGTEAEGGAQENQKRKERSSTDRPFPNRMSFLVVYFLRNICKPAFSVYTPWKKPTFHFLAVDRSGYIYLWLRGVFHRFIPSLLFSGVGFEVRSLVISPSTFLLHLKGKMEADGKLDS